MKKILHIDMDNVLVDFSSAVAQLSAETKARYAGRLDEVPGVFALMQPMPGALDAFRVVAPVFDTFILSTAPWDNPSAWSDKLNWVKAHLPAGYKRLILSHYKNLVRGDFLVDDRRVNGAERFAGKLILFGSDEFPNWDVVTEYLLNNR